MKQSAPPPAPQFSPDLRSRYERLWTLIEHAIEVKIPLLLQSSSSTTPEDTSSSAAAASRFLESAVRSLARAQECRMKLFACFHAPDESAPAVSPLPVASLPQAQSQAETAAVTQYKNPAIHPVPPIASPLPPPPAVSTLVPSAPQTAKPSVFNAAALMTVSNANPSGIRSKHNANHNIAKSPQNKALVSQHPRSPSSSAGRSPVPQIRPSAEGRLPYSGSIADTKAALSQLFSLGGSYSQLREQTAVPL